MPMKRKEVAEVINMVKKFNPKAFYTIEDVRNISGSTFKGDHIPESRISQLKKFPRAKKK